MPKVQKFLANESGIHKRRVERSPYGYRVRAGGGKGCGMATAQG